MAISKVIYYNWLELYRSARGNKSGIIILAYCLIKGYNNLIANGSYHLMNILKVDQIPIHLFKNHLRFFEGEIYSNYVCNDPQNYIKDFTFLFKKFDIKTKCDYLYILSQRSIANTSSRIPKNYLDKKYWNNKLITTDENYINFPLERT